MAHFSTIRFSVMGCDFGCRPGPHAMILIHYVCFFLSSNRVVRGPKAKKVEEYDSDDPACYKNEEIPDKVKVTQLVLRALQTALLLCV